MAKSPELAGYERSAKALLRKITAYAVSGDGDRKTELGFFRARDKLEDSMRRLGLTEDVAALAVLLLVKQTASNAPDLAREARAQQRSKEIKALDEAAADRRRWRIENGLEDPPKY